MKKVEKIEMSFVCDQEWSAMTPTKEGRFCDACKKEVFDFSNYKLRDIHLKLEEQPKLCGQYNIEHVDPDIITPINIPFKEKIIVYAGSFLMLFSVKSAIAQTKKAQTEQVVYTERQPNGIRKTADKTKSCDQEDTENNNNYHQLRRRRYRRLYLSKKFPFVVYRSERLRGRIRRKVCGVSF